MGIKTIIGPKGIRSVNIDGESKLEIKLPFTTAGQRVIYGRNISQLQSLGTATTPSIKQGSLAWDSSNNLFVHCLNVVSQSSTWGYVRRFTETPNMIANTTSGAKRYAFWFGSTTFGADPNTQGSGRLCHWPTRVISCMYWAESNHGDVIISLHKNGTSEDIGQLEEITKTVPAQTGILYNFSSGSYDSGDYISIGCDPSNSRTGNEQVMLTVELEETVTVVS